MAKKFVVNNNQLICGNVELHADLIKGRENYETIGGGYWHLDRDNNIMYFYGTSCDFGSITRNEFEDLNKSKYERGGIITLIFSEKSNLEEVLIKNNK